MPIAAPSDGPACPRACRAYRCGYSRGRCLHRARGAGAEASAVAAFHTRRFDPVGRSPGEPGSRRLLSPGEPGERRPDLRGRRLLHRPAPSTAGSEDPGLLWGLAASTRRLRRLPMHELPVRCRHTTRDRRFPGSAPLRAPLLRAPPRSRRPPRLPGVSGVRSAAPLLRDQDLKEPFRSSRSGLACLAQPREKLGSDEWCVKRQNHQQTQSTIAC